MGAILRAWVQLLPHGCACAERNKAVGSACLLVVQKVLKCLLNARFMALAASEEHMDKEKSTYFYVLMHKPLLSVVR